MGKGAGLMLGTVILGMVLVSQGWAQQDDSRSSEIEMEKTVVTATRAETPVENLPVSVTVITRQDIEKMPAKTVDEVLNKAAGLQVKRNKGLANTGSHTTVYMRGTGETSRVLVLKDGIPLNMAYTGSVDVWNTISLENIEKIEIVRGASSALYGSSAMGGVINIITKKPSKKPSGSVEIQGGSFDTYIGNASISMATDKFALRVSGGHKTTDGYEFYKDEDWEDYYKTPENKLTNVSLGADIWLGASLLRLDYEHLLEDSLSAAPTQYDGEQKNHNYMLGWQIPLGVADFSLKSYYFDAEYGSDARKYNSASGSFDQFYYDSTIPKDEYGLLLQISTELANHRLTVGSDLKRASCDSKYTYETGDRNFSGSQDFYALFVNDEMGFLDDRLILSAGARYDHWKNYDGDFYDYTTATERRIDYPEKNDDAVSPRAGIVFKLTQETKLRASFGTGFKAPSLYYLYKSGPHGATRFDLANPDLEAEKMVWSYDLGFDTQPNDHLTLSMTFYQSSFEDFLGDKTLDASEVPAWFSPDPGMAVIQKVNLGRVDIFGVEAGLEFKFDNKWSAFINHTYNESKIEEYDQDPAMEGHFLEYTPRHTTKIGVTYDNPDLLTLSVFLTHVGEQYGDLENSDTKKLDAYQVADLKISRKLFKGLEIFGSVNNLTDEEYKEYYTTYNPPITVMAGAKYTF
jgi:iron complex outermembrane receptor protein